ncbi:LutC/YkgG family protein [Cecembia calidifontis]|uniref:L-lactate dehydrogenase complex protein LldG n=1 Tax=Cecembia calidifontis TaxID=1187080 RepID=A0A4Q7P8F6_9BACT|nr:LUD domain-containing protein [Cecembia calidifontis]RZS96453.1 L-lactate dehydrogenase complex protein LldG [Cecembia calidifontis]
MSSREHILAKIKSIPRESKLLPDIPDFHFTENIPSRFIQSIESNKGEVITESGLKAFLETNRFEKIISLVSGMENLSTQLLPSDAHELNELEIAIIQGQFGVAENGAIWLTDENLGLRALPFITEHLVIVMDEKSLVSNMHEAYQRIGAQHSGFGLFIAGPSKTADIEQSLVIGAHGAKSLRVVLK